MNLIEFGFDIEYTEIERKNGSQKSVDDVNVIITDIYYNHTLEPSEVKLISDGLLFSRYVTGKFKISLQVFLYIFLRQPMINVRMPFYYFQRHYKIIFYRLSAHTYHLLSTYLMPNMMRY